MSLEFSIYNTDIDLEYIKSYPIKRQSFQFNGKEIIAATMKIILDGTDPDVFSPVETGSLFYGADWFNQPVTIYDNVQNTYLWNGRLKNIRDSWKNRTVVIETTNWVRDVADTVCVYSDTTGATTPAEHVKNILIKDGLLGIDLTDLNLSGFTEAINIQTAAGVYCNVNYTQDKNKKCLSVIKELCRIAQMHIYTDDNNKICLYQWQAWDGLHGTIINDRDLKTKSFETWYDNKNIYNDISIYYKSGAGIAQYPSTDATSITQYGKRTFSVPDRDPDSTAANNNILLEDVTSATWCSNLVKSRFGDLKQKYKMTLNDGFKFLNLAEQIDLSFDPFTTEPTIIEKIEYNQDRGDVNIEGEFLNIPHEYYARDIEPPGKVELIAATAGSGSVALAWTQSLETDHIGYKIYFTTSKGEWVGEFSNLGPSPVTIKNPSLNGSAYCITTLYQLSIGATYYFKITSFDSSFNESADSNVLSAIVT